MPVTLITAQLQHPPQESPGLLTETFDEFTKTVRRAKQAAQKREEAQLLSS